MIKKVNIQKHVIEKLQNGIEKKSAEVCQYLESNPFMKACPLCFCDILW